MDTKIKESAYVNSVHDTEEGVFHLSVCKSGYPLAQYAMVTFTGDLGIVKLFTLPVKSVEVNNLEEAKQELLKAFRHIS
jgi:hypothetical protein